ncbi:MAG: fructosamine kinase family protein [Clostridia bacterium]|nr:fructosamine kinase family protein [Clostridia bacterium]
MELLTNQNHRTAVEEAVTRSTGERFTVKNVRPTHAAAMHETAFFDGTLGGAGRPYGVFVKLGKNPFSHEQFDMEARGLDYIRAHSPVRTPEVIGVAHTEDAALLILEVIHTVRPETHQDFERMGRGLASLHRVENARCGFDFPTYLGIFRQDNTWKDSWREFYGECRLYDTLKMAIKAERMNASECATIEKLIRRLPEICPEPKTFSLLHGDPWIGNLLYDGREPVLIDCSLYYGNREIDLTTVDFFCPVSDRFFAAYEEAFPKEYGFRERADLWKINQWLGHVTLYGDKYKNRLWNAVKPYL